MNAICKYCKKEIEPSNDSEISIIERFGQEVISHFDCAYKEIHGKDFEWKDIKKHK